MSREDTKDPIPLRDMQTWMQNALVDPRGVSREDLARRIVPSNKLSASQRLGIYQTSYILRLCKCLAEQFPALGRALGPDLFDQFAREYLAEMPSQSYTLYDLGLRFELFLQDSRPDKDLPETEQESWIDFMIDLARYERQLFVMFDAPGHEGKDWPSADTLDADLVLQPCFALGAYGFAVAAYYHAGQDEEGAGVPARMNTYAAMVRKDFLTTTYPITQHHHSFLQAMLVDKNVDHALERVARETGLPIGILRESWHKEIRPPWIREGFFVHRDFV